MLPELDDPDPIPLARLEPGSALGGLHDPASSVSLPGQRAFDDHREPAARPARIVLYRRPLLARADGEEELAELVLDVIVEQFAHWLGVDPQTVDPGYPAEE
jgi:predicted Zn-dependent protease with MMP-like domain